MPRQTAIILLLFLALSGIRAKKLCGDDPRSQCVPHHLCDGSSVDLRSILSEGNDGCESTEKCCPPHKILQKNLHNRWIDESEQSGCGHVNKKGVTFTMQSADGFSQENELPWMTALLHRNGTFLGGGSLIASDVVLTASHVTSTFRSHDIIVRAGEWDMAIQSEQLSHVNVRVRMIVRHPDFNRRNGENNIALLFLARPLETSRHIRPICLPSRNQRFDRKRCIVSGWGKDAIEQANLMNILKKLDLQVVSPRTCETQMKRHKGRNFRLHDSMMCAGGEEGKDACNGDGGSPLACPLESDPERFEQAGIVNWGVNCGMADTPGVYTDVAKFRSWIDEQIKNFSRATEDSILKEEEKKEKNESTNDRSEENVIWDTTTRRIRQKTSTTPRIPTRSPDEIDPADIFTDSATIANDDSGSDIMIVTRS